MTYFGSTTRTIGVSALIALSMLPSAAYAGKHSDAVQAIAQAKGKIEAGDKVNVVRQAPELQAQARASLSSAQDLLSHGHKDEAISAARKASEFADQAIVSADNIRMASERERRHDAQDAAAAATQSASDANVRASLAQQATANANASAADADHRAALAQQAAQNANASVDGANLRTAIAQQAAVDANARTDALRNAPTTTTTTVAVVQDAQVRHSAAPAHRAVRHKMRHHVLAHQTRKSTTTVTTTRS